MVAINARLAAQQQLAYVPHTSVEGEAWQFIKGGITSSAGSSTGTTLIDTSGDSGGADTYNGRYWVKITSGTNKGMWKRIVDDDGAGTLTFENNGFDNQVASAVTYEIWKSPEPVVVIDSSSSAEDAVDAVRAEGDDFWNNYWLIPITGAHRGDLCLITDFTSVTGTFVLDGFSISATALAAGDVCLLRKFIEASDIADGLTEDYIARPSARANHSIGDGVVAVRGGTFGFKTQIVPSGTLSANGRHAALSPIGHLLPPCGFVEYTDESETGGTSVASTAVKITTGTHEQFTLGNAIVWRGTVSWITDSTDGAGGEDTLTVTPGFVSPYPQTSDVVYATRTYHKSTSGDVFGCTIELEQDGVRTTMTGCKGNVVLEDAPVPLLAFTFQVDHWIQEIEAAPYLATYGSSAPVLAIDRRVYLSTTATNIKGFTASLNTTVAPKNVQGSYGLNGRAGYQITGYAAGGTFQELLDADTAGLPQLLRWTARTAKDLIVTYGSGSGFFGVRIPVARMIQVAKHAAADGMLEAPNVLAAQDAGSTVDGDSVNTKIPDFAFFIT